MTSSSDIALDEFGQVWSSNDGARGRSADSIGAPAEKSPQNDGIRRRSRINKDPSEYWSYLYTGDNSSFRKARFVAHGRHASYVPSVGQRYSWRGANMPIDEISRDISIAIGQFYKSHEALTQLNKAPISGEFAGQVDNRAKHARADHDVPFPEQREAGIDGTLEWDGSFTTGNRFALDFLTYFVLLLPTASMLFCVFIAFQLLATFVNGTLTELLAYGFLLVANVFIVYLAFRLRSLLDPEKRTLRRV